MYRPLESSVVPLTDLGNIKSVYLGSCPPTPDSSMVWGTEIETNQLEAFIAQRNRDGAVLLSAPHVLLKAVARALSQHPTLRRRVLSR